MAERLQAEPVAREEQADLIVVPMTRDELIERHLPLARALAHRYRHTRESMDDLVQVASVGLVKAADRWEPARGFAFSSLATPTILGELRRHFRDHTWDVRPPRGLQELCLVVERACNRLLDLEGREPTVDELARHLDRPTHVVAEALHAMRQRKLPSLDAPAPVADDASVEVGEIVGCEEPGYEQVESQDTLDRLIGRFDERAQTVLRLRFQHDLLQSDIGRRVGCSQMHVSRLIRGALDSLASAPELRAA